MAILFDLPEGPWKKLFDGNFQDHRIEIYQNPESYVLTVIFDAKEAEHPKGAIVNLYKILASTGEVEQFVETLPREVVLLSRHQEEKNIKYLLFGSGPAYLPFNQKKFSDELSLLMKHLSTATSLALEVAKAYDLDLYTLEESNEEIKEAFFTEPLLMPALSAEGKPMELKDTQISKQGDIYFGLTRDKKRVIEPLEYFLCTLVEGGKYPERRHVLQIISESFLFANIPLIVFDHNREFGSLGSPTLERDALKKHEIDADPIGFPIARFNVGKEVFVDLTRTAPEGFAEQFGIGKGVIAQAIIELLKDGEVGSIEDAIHKAKRGEIEGEVKGYNLYKLIRVLSVMNVRYPDVFGGSYDIDEIAKSWVKAIGRASLIELDGGDERMSLLIIHNVLKALIEKRKKYGRGKGIQTAVLIPEAWKFLPGKNESLIGKEIVKLLFELRNYGIAYVLDTEKQIDIDTQLFRASDAKVNIIGHTDIGIRLPDKKTYRVNARPSLSQEIGSGN